MSTQKNDYLTLLYHLYDEPKQKLIIENEEEKLLVNKREEAINKRNEMINDYKNKKLVYEPGFWNPNAVFLNGLGKEPEPDESEDPLMKFEKSIEQSKPKYKKIHFFKSSLGNYKEE